MTLWLWIAIFLLGEALWVLLGLRRGYLRPQRIQRLDQLPPGMAGWLISSVAFAALMVLALIFVVQV